MNDCPAVILYLEYDLLCNLNILRANVGIRKQIESEYLVFLRVFLLILKKYLPPPPIVSIANHNVIKINLLPVHFIMNESLEYCTF